MENNCENENNLIKSSVVVGIDRHKMCFLISTHFAHKSHDERLFINVTFLTQKISLQKLFRSLINFYLY